MKNINLWGRFVAVAAVLLLIGSPAFAQLQTGNLYGVVTDDQGAPLPGVTVTLTGGGAPQVQVTNAQGQFRFLGLSPASYNLRAELEGFSTIEYPNISINVGRNTQIEVQLSAAVEDVITVTAESPLLDERRISTGATINETELEKIPTSRDPWAILQSTPGVLTDRMNVGGNESGQQSQYIGPGSSGDQAIWAVDGMVITDMAALGSSPAYYDFDSFEEMQVTTGGSDATIATGGVVLNMVTKRGTNEWRGTGRYITSSDDWQSDLEIDADEFGPGQAAFAQGNRIIDIEDWGAEIGGPIVRDRLWVWGSYGEQNVDLRTAPAPGFPEGVQDFTTLETANVKLNAQITPNNSATLFALNSDKIKIGRNAGPTRPGPTTWNQSKFGDDPTAWKLEDTHIFSSNFYVTGLFSIVNGGFQLVPQGGIERGPAGPTTYWDQNLVFQHSFVLYQTERPQEQIRLDASNFFNTGDVSHELKFGAGVREAEVTSLSVWPGAGIIYNGPSLFGTDMNVIAVNRPAFYTVTQDYTSLYLQDTLSIGNLTANVGLRYDIQEADIASVTVPASPLVPELLPAVNYEGDRAPEWKDLTPRLGLTYALGAERKTLLRASYSRFAEQMGTGVGNWLNPLGYQSYAYFYTNATGPNVGAGDLIGGPLFFSSNVNPETGLLIQSNGLDADLEAPQTDELLFSVEHALLPEFVVGVNLTYRQITGILETELLVFDGDAYSADNLNRIGRLHRRDDYIQSSIDVTLPNGEERTVPFFRLRPEVSSRGGQFLENGDREQEYQGVSVILNKRLANRWMLRGNFTLSDWEWSEVPDSEIENPTRTLGGGDREGDPVLQGSGTGSGAKGGVYINSEWSYSLNALYQVAPDRPWGFNVAASFQGREGYPLPFFGRTGFFGNMNGRLFPAATTSPDEFRQDDIHTIDARIEKEFNFSDFGLTLGVDVFNLTNEATVLQRQHRLGLGTSGHVTEVLSPRLVRVGARLSFR